MRHLIPLLLAALTTAAVAQDPIVFHGGRIWTGDTARPQVQALLVVGERILHVGTDAEVLARAGDRAERVDLAGRRVVPGITDSHVHFLSGGDELLAPDLRSASSAEEVASRLATAAARVPKGTWLTSGSWDHENWPGAELPTAAVLDRHVPDHPVFVARLDGHMGVANGLALRMAGVTRDTPDPEGGTIVRDARGEPAGVLKDSAMSLVGRHVPEWTDEQRLERAFAALAHAASLGVTGFHDMLEGYDALETYQTLKQRGLLTARATLYSPIASHERWSAVSVARGFGDAWLAVNGVKGFADGSLGSTTAWFFAPYEDSPDTSGLAMMDLGPGGPMEARVRGSAAAGLQPAIHAIGDRANRAILDMFERLGVGAAARPRIEHAQHLTPADIARFAKLGVIASMQPYHCADDGRWAEKRIGRERCDTTYAFRDLLDQGARLAFGSDWPVAPLSPWLGIHAAVTRETLDGKNPDGWIPRQKIGVEEALRAYTSGAAWAAFRERDLGTIEAGKLADFAVLDRDILAIPVREIRDIQVEMTVAGGRIVHERMRPVPERLQVAVVTRAAWSAALPDACEMRPHRPARITVHHSGIAIDGWPAIEGREWMRRLQRYSQGEKHWGDVPYHWSIAPDGTVLEGRDPRFAGDTNTTYDPAGHLLIEVVGDFDRDEPTAAQLDALARVVAWLSARYGIAPETLSSHRDHAQTTCPGAKLAERIASGEIVRRVRALQGGSTEAR